MKRAVIIGMSGGVGGETAKLLSNKGYEVIGTYLQSPCRDLNLKNVKSVKLDITNKDEVRRFVEMLQKEGKIDFFVNTVSKRALPRRFDSISREEMEEWFSTNVVDNFELVKSIVPLMKEDADIVFVLTEYVHGIPPQYLLPYVSTKYALLGMMKSLSVELLPKKIRVNAVSPGMMETRFTADIPKYVKEVYASKSVDKEMVKTASVAKAIEHIIDNKLNGQNLNVFGQEAVQWK